MAVVVAAVGEAMMVIVGVAEVAAVAVIVDAVAEASEEAEAAVETDVVVIAEMAEAAIANLVMAEDVMEEAVIASLVTEEEMIKADAQETVQKDHQDQKVVDLAAHQTMLQKVIKAHFLEKDVAEANLQDI